MTKILISFDLIVNSDDLWHPDPHPHPLVGGWVGQWVGTLNLDPIKFWIGQWVHWDWVKD